MDQISTHRYFLLFTAFVILLSHTASGAEIRQDRYWNHIISINGEIEPDDEFKISMMTRNLRGATIALESPGGDVVTAIAIGRLIRSRGFETVASGPCASACALLWLAGSRRMIGDTGQVGFHAAYNSTTMQVAGAGNALIGAYLSELHLSDAAIVYITRKAPSEIQWLTTDDSGKFGLNWEVDTSNRPTPEPGSRGQKMLDSCIEATNEEWSQKQLADDVVRSFCGCVSQRLSAVMTDADWAQPMPRPKVVGSYNFCRMRGCQRRFETDPG